MKKCVSVWLSLACCSICLQFQSITLMAYAMSCFETKRERRFFVALTGEQDVHVMWQEYTEYLLYITSEIRIFPYQVLRLEEDNSLEPDSEYPYFPLREDAAEAVHRGTRWSDASPKDLVLIQLVFTAVGVATLWPDVLYNQPGGESTRYRFNGTLHKEFRSADGVSLYNILDEKLQFM